MTPIFVFQNGTSELVLKPLNSTDKRYLDMLTEGRKKVVIKASTDDSLILQFSEESK